MKPILIVSMLLVAVVAHPYGYPGNEFDYLIIILF